MILPDVNVLVYAFRRDVPQHDVCKAWLDGVIAADAHFGASPLVFSALVRITTNPRAFKQPSSIDEAFAYCDNILNQANCELVRPGERHWMIFKRLCLEGGIRGPRVSDAWFAALALEHDCTWITYDRDFARFAGLTWQEPTT